MFFLGGVGAGVLLLLGAFRWFGRPEEPGPFRTARIRNPWDRRIPQTPIPPSPQPLRVLKRSVPPTPLPRCPSSDVETESLLLHLARYGPLHG